MIDKKSYFLLCEGKRDFYFPLKPSKSRFRSDPVSVTLNYRPRESSEKGKAQVWFQGVEMLAYEWSIVLNKIFDTIIEKKIWFFVGSLSVIDGPQCGWTVAATSNVIHMLS
ncbi:hypothetical protein NPIL_508941 [Nephila pilipes]|uniref:Uncharacterized protein n=1 Tax=Nephila pilipes TaxID=299642 RepID=A0A8X6TUY4_NEPPI|nr:hypothetical protein NPIL_508941 [Nephila pilipes]